MLPLLRRLVIPAIMMMVVALLLPSPSLAGTITDNFDDNTMNPWLWQQILSGTGPTVAEANQRLEITIPGTSTGNLGAGYQTNLTFTGDFEVIVDFDLINWPTPPINGIRSGIGFVGGAVERTSWEGNGEVYLTDFGSVITSVGTSDTSGKLRLTRTGTMARGYYWSGTAWNLIGFRDFIAVDDPTTISLTVWGSNSYLGGRDVEMAFDNFQISGPEVVPLPPGVWLLGSGLLGLALPALRRRIKQS